MNFVCRPIRDRSVIIFINHILVYSKSQDLHEEHLREVLETLKRDKLYAKFTKCEFCCMRCSFLVHLVNQNYILIDPTKVLTLMRWEVPRFAYEIQSFLGLAGY